MTETSAAQMPESLPSPPAEADTTIDLASLLWLVSSGDHTAFRSLYAQSGKQLYALALRITGDERLATEALHTALAQIWRRTVQHTPGPLSAEAWLIAHIRGRATELLRRRRREGAPPEDTRPADDLAAGLARLHGTPAADRMRHALETLPPQPREVLVLAFLEGHTSVELAQRLRLPIGTIKSLARDGLAALRAALEPPA